MVSGTEADAEAEAGGLSEGTSVSEARLLGAREVAGEDRHTCIAGA